MEMTMTRTLTVIYDEIESVSMDLLWASSDQTRDQLEDQLSALWDEVDVMDPSIAAMNVAMEASV
jgi:hypothetical protein